MVTFIVIDQPLAPCTKSMDSAADYRKGCTVETSIDAGRGAAVENNTQLSYAWPAARVLETKTAADDVNVSNDDMIYIIYVLKVNCKAVGRRTCHSKFKGVDDAELTMRMQ